MRVTYKGKEYRSLKEICEEKGINYHSLTSFRVENNVSIEESIDHFVNSQHVVANLWTDQEVQTLRQMADEGYSRKQIAEALGRTTGAISKRCNQLGIYTKGTKGTIGEKEKEDILAADNKGLCRLAKKYDVSAMTIYAHNKKLGGCKKKIAHEDEVRELAGKLNAAEIAKKLGISVSAVRNIAYKCNISLKVAGTANNGRRKWTQAEIIYLKEHKGKTPFMEICRNLERGKHVVRQKCRELGI